MIILRQLDLGHIPAPAMLPHRVQDLVQVRPIHGALGAHRRAFAFADELAVDTDALLLACSREPRKCRGPTSPPLRLHDHRNIHRHLSPILAQPVLALGLAGLDLAHIAYSRG